VAGTPVNPSDVIGSRFGGSLAISPATSVTMGLNMSYLVNARPIDLVVPQSDRLLSTVDVGFATVVGPRTCSLSRRSLVSLATYLISD
jgi:hypothetical protein